MQHLIADRGDASSLYVLPEKLPTLTRALCKAVHCQSDCKACQGSPPEKRTHSAMDACNR